MPPQLPEPAHRQHKLVTVHVLTSVSHPPQYIWCCLCGADGAVRYDTDERARADWDNHMKHATKVNN